MILYTMCEKPQLLTYMIAKIITVQFL